MPKFHVLKSGENTQLIKDTHTKIQGFLRNCFTMTKLFI
jgi:hypothetical protein